MKAFLLLLCGGMLLVAQPKIQVQGHRGARAVMPENTLPAFEYAIRVGADVIELDLAVTKDNVLVVSHDPLINEKICSGPAGANRTIRQLTLTEVKAWDCGAKANPEFPRQKAIPGTRIPTLEEVLNLAPKGKFEFNIETKSDPKRPELQPEPEEFARMVADLVRKKGLASRVIVQSFDWRTIDAMKKIAPEIRVAALHPAGMSDAVLKMDYIKAMNERGYKIASPHYKFVNKLKVQQARKLGMTVIPWTANDTKTWDELIAAGVDGIITDDPEGLIAHLKAKGLR
jgi:glycerophosphoryl diester phosphodiesterase